MNRLLLSTAVAALILAAPAAFAADDHHDHGDKTTQHDNGPKGPSRTMSGPTMGGPKMSGGNMSGPNHTDRSIHTDTTDHHDHTVHTDHTVSHDLSNNNNNNNNNNSDHRVKSKSNISNNMMGGDNNRHSNGLNGNNNHSHGHINFNRHNVTASRHFHYRGGAYRWPGGYHYQRWSFGMTLPSVFWGQNYWIDDYQDYGLAYPPNGAVWVRYGDDALLIDRYSGEILEVVYGQFD